MAEYLGAALQLRDSGRFEEAEALLIEVVERFPAEPRPRVEWALLAHARRDWPEAVRRWQLVRDIFPNEVVAHALGAVGLRELGRYDEAEILLAAARESFPDDLGIANENAWLATHRRDWAEALRRWGRIRKQFPDHPAGYTGMAMIQRELRWFDEADAMLTDAVERFPAQPGPHIDFARLSETRGNWAEAAARWDAVRERFPGHPAGYISGAGALRELGRLDEAEALLAEAVERFPDDAGLAIGYAAAAHRRRDWEETVRRCETLRAAFPLEPIGYTLAGAALRELGRYDAAEPLLASACARFRADIGVATEHALIALAKRDWARAAERWDEVCRRDPKQLGASLHQAVALRELGRYEDAEALLHQAAAKFPDAAQPLIELARVAEARQDWEEAVARWREARTRFPDESATYVGEAAALRRSGRLEQAEPLLLKAAERLPHDPAPLADWALIAHERRDWDEALKRWDSVHANFPDHRNAYLFGATALRELGRLDEAEALLRSALGRFSPDFGLQVEHGRIAEARGDMAEARERWAALKSAFPQYSLGYISEARGLRQLGRFDEAEQLLATAVSLFPDDPGARSEHAWLAQITRDFEQAADRWQEMRSRLPDLPLGYSVGAAALRELNRFDEAEALLADANKRFPQDASVILERARLAHMRRDWPAAAACWEVVRAQLPNEIEGYASGGIALAEQGRVLDADEVLKEGLGRFPSNQRLYAVFADLASMRNDWPEAFSRWTEAQNRFPDARDFGARRFVARLRLYEVDPEGIAALEEGPAKAERGARLCATSCWPSRVWATDASSAWCSGNMKPSRWACCAGARSRLRT